VEEEARRLVLLAVKVPSVINLEEVLNLDAVKLLQAQSKEVFDFINLFTLPDAKDFSNKVSQYSELI